MENGELIIDNEKKTPRNYWVYHIHISGIVVYAVAKDSL